MKIVIDGKPVPKERPRRGKNGVMYTPRKTAKYEKVVRESYAEQSGYRFPDGVPIDARVYVYYQIPKATSKKKRAAMLNGSERPTKKPDTDNLYKSLMDSLNGVAYKDDSQIVDCQVRKFYADEWKTVLILQEAQHD